MVMGLKIPSWPAIWCIRRRVRSLSVSANLTTRLEEAPYRKPVTRLVVENVQRLSVSKVSFSLLSWKRMLFSNVLRMAPAASAETGSGSLDRSGYFENAGIFRKQNKTKSEWCRKLLSNQTKPIEIKTSFAGWPGQERQHHVMTGTIKNTATAQRMHVVGLLK